MGKDLFLNFTLLLFLLECLPLILDTRYLRRQAYVMKLACKLGDLVRSHTAVMPLATAGLVAFSSRVTSRHKYNQKLSLPLLAPADDCLFMLQHYSQYGPSSSWPRS